VLKKIKVEALNVSVQSQCTFYTTAAVLLLLLIIFAALCIYLLNSFMHVVRVLVVRRLFAFQQLYSQKLLCYY